MIAIARGYVSIHLQSYFDSTPVSVTVYRSLGRGRAHVVLVVKDTTSPER
jgi:hypothetical protein